MLLTTNTIPLSARFGDARAIELIAQAGFDGIDYSVTDLEGFPSVFTGDHIAYAERIKALAACHGIRICQAHAPMPYGDTLEDYIRIRREQSIIAIEAAAVMGAELIVVHPLQWGRYKDNAEMFYDMNMEFYRELLPYAERSGIKIACENIFQSSDGGIVDGVGASPHEFNRYIDDISSPYFTACVDFGHAELTGRKAQDMIRAMGCDRIRALHIHDNDRVTDLHYLPGSGVMEWDEICRALADIGYRGNFNFEPDGFLDAYDEDFLPTAMKFMHDLGRHYISKINSYKQKS